VVKALENPDETDSDRLSHLGKALEALAPRMNPNEAARLADAVVKTLENPRETDSDYLSRLGSALAVIASQIPPARETRLLALSNCFLGKISGPPDRTRIARTWGLGSNGTENRYRRAVFFTRILTAALSLVNQNLVPIGVTNDSEPANRVSVASNSIIKHAALVGGRGGDFPMPVLAAVASTLSRKPVALPKDAMSHVEQGRSFRISTTRFELLPGL
jgi:hypothetical protein